MRVLFIAEREDADGISPGYALRVRDVRAWLQTDPDVESVDYEYLTAPGQSKRRRLATVLGSVGRLKRTAQHFDFVVVEALNAPHMSYVGALIARKVPTAVDICDSARRSYEAQRREGATSAMLLSLLGRAVLRGSRRSLRLYISSRDALSDFAERVDARAEVVPPAPRNDLATLDDFNGPATRIAIPADLSSYHNRTGFDMLLRAVKSLPTGVLPPIEVYGPHAPQVGLPLGVTYVGWSPSLRDVYAGDTAIFAPNVYGAGVQNKVWESIWAKRPVLVGEGAAGSLADSPWVFTFRDELDLPGALQRLASYRPTARAVRPPERQPSVGAAYEKATLLGRART